MIPVHFMPYGDTTVCGIARRGAGELRWTPHRLAVNCKLCQDTAQWKTAKQLIPVIPKGTYHGR